MNEKSVSNHFMDYFSNVGKALAEKIRGNKVCTKFITAHIHNYFFLENIIADKVQSTIKSLKLKP